MIEIPGYRIMRPLGRGGMATVYLALQESVQREVALKVMSTTLLGDPQFGERFLREARIAAKLRHPNVVQVHDVGVAGDHHFIAMEFLPGGQVLTRNGAPRPIGFALRVMREIAEALHYSQSKGVVHRDIKPDNILLREDGTAVLTDFGIARASDNARMTRTGAIIGTPHYMSPEQARGLPLDGRADLYSLGIVFHEMLVGRVPYQAEDSLAVGIMHITAPLPRLPDELQDMQPLLDRLLAKEPSQRFQDGRELAACITTMERQSGSSHATRAMPVVARAEPRRAESSGQRSEPLLGSMDDALRSSGPRRRVNARPRRGGGGWLLLLAVLLCGGGAAWYYQDQLRELLPQTRKNDLLARADQALLSNVLSRPDGQGARELYQAALALDPDSLPAQQGLQRVGERLLKAGRTALAANDLDAARAALAQARELSVPASEADALQRALDQLQSRGVEIGSVLDAAQQAREAGRLDEGEDSAVALYRQALAADPGNAIAAAGLRDALTAMLERARALAVAGEFEQATQQVDAVAAIDSAHLGLPDARARLAQIQSDRRAQTDARLDAADSLLAAGKLTSPAGSNAREAFQQILTSDPGNARAQTGLRRIAAQLVAQAERQMSDFEFERAEGLLKLAEQVDPGVPGVAAARSRMRGLEQKRDQVALPDPASAETRARIGQLLDEARRAAAAGNLLAPPGDSAYDKYRAVRALDPGNADASRGVSELPALARQRFEDAIGANRLSTARGAVEALATLSPTDGALAGMRQRLARSLLGQAAERLGEGDIRRASQAFDQARELDPGNDDLPSMQARLEQARGG